VVFGKPVYLVYHIYFALSISILYFFQNFFTQNFFYISQKNITRILQKYGSIFTITNAIIYVDKK